MSRSSKRWTNVCIPVAGILISTVLTSSACQASHHMSPRASWISELLDVSYDVSLHLVRLETDRDAVADGRGKIVGFCDPKMSLPTYDEISKHISRLLVEAARIGIEEQHLVELENVREGWLSVQRTHTALWNETENLPRIAASDRCLRTSAIVEFILSIEKNLRAAIRGALTADL